MNFATALETHGARPALILADGATLSYQALAQRADAIYAADGAPPRRTLVAVEAANSAAAVCAYLGALRAGHALLLVDGALDSALRERLYAQFDVSRVWSGDGEADGDGENGRWRWRGGDGPALHPELALLLSTSGSTGAPKLVKLTLAALDANARSIAAYLGLTAAERPMLNLPLHYSYGMSVLNSHLAQGATVLLSDEPVTARGFWEFFKQQQATSLAGVPTTYAMLRQLRFERMALPSLTTLTQAGGRLAPELVRWFAEQAGARGQRFFVMYGQTEAAPRISYVPPARLLDKAGAIGVAIPGGALDLVADDGSVVDGAGQAGQLRYRGPNVMMGYAETAAELALGDQLGGVLLTGDLAERDADGYFYLRGRLKRFIKVFGNRISLDEVEAQLRAKGYDAAVTGRDDLLLVALQGADADAVAALAAALPGWYRLHHSALRVRAVDAFPLSSAGKIRYPELLDALAPAKPGTPS
ncbi:AMP-binding protein [Duganella sp. FT50W]|uniref:AMP-binding protein n=1 Tax=Duganella lactea TaxID=2692173 RepID=A0A6L8MT66_9BURK|nr:AMP-binding protein [Duganella lactea]